MQINIAFRHMDPSPSLQRYASDKLEHVVSKYVTGEDIDSKVVFSVERFWHIVNFTININGLTVKGVEKTEDMYSSIDKALDKVERQMRKYKDKIRDHKPSSARQRAFSMNVLAASPPAEEETTSAPEPVTPELTEAAPEASTPQNGVQVLRRETYAAPAMSNDKAIMQLELREASFFVFTSEDTGNLCIIYRRDDGNYGLIVPEAEQG